eukprot:TRINITY_DN12281_c0_g1_i1.p1 TRINITY_DN12281_c0_g1~~TRINITY_DN12281_c0_g1_i1.p1  ORF type:complete len:330 (-),score=36.28 TRINITY_DN12281_c0_g1_i1:10-999(-)
MTTMDALLSQFNLQSELPTFFELYTQEFLSQALPQALQWALKSLAVSFPSVWKIAKNPEEWSHLIWLACEYHFVVNYDATFAENFYSIRRWKIGPDGKRHRLSHADHLYTMFSEVGLSYISTKLKGWNTEYLEQLENEVHSSERSTGLQVQKKKLLNLFHKKLYRYLRCMFELTQLWFSLRYIFKKSKYYSLLLWFRGITLHRLTMKDMQTWQQDGGMKLMNGSRLAMLVAFILWSVGEWWWAPKKKEGDTNDPIPPPPPKPKVVRGLPIDDSLCKQCLKPMVNATQCVPSGFVFCYTCIQSYVSEHHKCPVTNIAASPECLRRIFEVT